MTLATNTARHLHTQM